MLEKRPPLQYKTLKKYLLQKGITKSSYEDLLWTYEWLDFRDSVLLRDNKTCTNCKNSRYKQLSEIEFLERLTNSGYGKYFDLLEGRFLDSPGKLSLMRNDNYPSKMKIDKTVQLEVHHNYYIWNKLPWEYDISALTTLCDNCHENEHFPDKTIFSDESMTQHTLLIKCSRCSGKGYLSEYKHVQSGVCFNCGGLGGVMEGTLSNLFDIK